VAYRVLADAVVLLHAAFVVFVVLGGLLALRWPRAAWIHLPVVAWGAGIEFLGGFCPLTPLENRWRRLAGEDGYPGGFVEHYVIGALYPDGLTRTTQLALGVVVVIVNAAVYAAVWHRYRRRRGCAPTPAAASGIERKDRSVVQLRRNVAAVLRDLLQYGLVQPHVHLCGVAHQIGRAAELGRKFLACRVAAVDVEQLQ
jgi:hypothetical protein